MDGNNQITQWEYKTIEKDISDEQLNKLGDQGWEATCSASRNGYTDRILMKRPKQKQTSSPEYSYSR